MEQLKMTWNITNIYKDGMEKFHTGNTIIMVIMILNAVLTLVTNPFALAAFIKSKKLQGTVANTFIMNGCVADTLFGIFISVYASCRLVYISQYSMIPGVQTLFQASITGSYITMLMSVLNVLFIGIDRSLATMRPITYRKTVTVSRARIVITIAWMYDILVLSVLSACYYASSPSLLTMLLSYEGFSQITIDYYLRTQGILIVGLTGILYCKISITLRRQSKRRIGILGVGNKVSQKNSQVTKMTSFIVVVTGVTWFPYSSVALCPHFDPILERYEFLLVDTLASLGVAIASTSCYLNIFIYAWCNKDFREALRQVLGMRTKQESAPIGTGTVSSHININENGWNEDYTTDNEIKWNSQHQ